MQLLSDAAAFESIMTLSAPLIVVMLLALFVGAIAWAKAVATRRRRQARRERGLEIEQFAKKSGHRFFETGADSLLRHLGQYDLFTRGSSKTIFNVMFGEADGVKTAAFDYLYITRDRHGPREHLYSVVYLQDLASRFPAFSLRPMNFFTRPLPLTSPRKLAVSSNSDFKNSFLIEGNDESRVAALFSKDVQALLTDRLSNFCIESRGSELLVFSESLVDLSEWKYSFADVQRLRELFLEAQNGRS